MLLSALPMLLGSSVANRPIKLSLEAETTASVVRSLSAVSLMFIIMVTPWAILQVSRQSENSHQTQTIITGDHLSDHEAAPHHS